MPLDNKYDDSEAGSEEEVNEGINEDDPEVEEQPDGSAIITIKETGPAVGKFYDNLSEVWSESLLDSISRGLLDKIGNDIVSRKKRDEQYEEGIRRTGLGADAPGGAQFNGASRVVHPLMAEACVDFSASTIKELFPPNGPVRSHFIGDSDRNKADKAALKVEHMNWQLTEQVSEYRGELEQMLTQLPLGGSQYLKLYWNEEEKRPAAEAVFIDDVFLPYAASNFYTAPRVTHRQYIDEETYDNRVSTGLYRDIKEVIRIESEVPIVSKSDSASNKIEGRDKTGENEDGIRELYEIYTRLNVEDEFNNSSRAVPYVVTIDVSTEKVIAVYRNWEESDEGYTKIDWLIEFQFIPWRGACGIGLPHLIGGLSGALTGALRALLDSAHINNAATLLKLKGARMSGQSQEVDITGIQEIEGPGGVDDIRKLAMPMPFNPPSSVLFSLLGWLDTAAKGVVTTAEEKISDAGNEMAVGTAMALIEQGSKVFSAIHARLHRAQARCLAILHRLNRMYLDDEVKLESGLKISRSDYEGPMDVIPVSDPQIFSETQRFAQVQAIAQRAGVLPQLYNVVEVERRILNMMKVQDPDKLLVAPPNPVRMNPINENTAMYMGKPAIAFMPQDHAAHIKAHISFMSNPFIGGNPMTCIPLIPLCLEHIKQHIGMLYTHYVYNISKEILYMPPEEALKTKDDKVIKKLEEFLAEANDKALIALQQFLQPFAQAIQMAFQTMQSRQPPPPIDPSQVQLQLGQAEIQRNSVNDQADIQLRQQAQQFDQQKIQSQLQLQIQKLQLQLQKEQQDHQHLLLTLQNRVQTNANTNNTQLQIAGMDKHTNDMQNSVANAANIMDNSAVMKELAIEHASNQMDDFAAHRQMDIDHAANQMAAQSTDASTAAGIHQTLIGNAFDQLKQQGGGK